jgi:hypothetical protein
MTSALKRFKRQREIGTAHAVSAGGTLLACAQAGGRMAEQRKQQPDEPQQEDEGRNPAAVEADEALTEALEEAKANEPATRREDEEAAGD